MEGMQVLMVVPARPQPDRRSLVTTPCSSLRSRLYATLGEAVDRHRQRHELDAVGEPLEAEVEPPDAGIDVGAGEPEPGRPSITMGDRLDDRARGASTDRRRSARTTISEKYSAGPKLQRDRGERRRRDRDQKRRDAAGEETSRSPRCAERRAGHGRAAPIWWPSSVVTTDDRLARDIDQDRGGRAAVLGGRNRCRRA